MRNCTELLVVLESKFNEEFVFLQDIIKKVDNNGDRMFFVGFRNGYLDLYYRGMRVFDLKIENDTTEYTTDIYYLKGSGITKSTFSFNQMKTVLPNILRQIEKHVSGNHDGKKRREKVCQQWLINKTNQNMNDWYYLDMEYIDDGIQCGRFDLVAIKRKPDNYGKHEVALIELKVKKSAYGGLGNDDYNKNREKYIKLKENLFNPDPEIHDLKLGSGLVSHIADFLRYLKNTNSYKNQLRQELVNMIDSNLKLGVLNETDCLSKVSIDALKDVPSIYIVSYTYALTLDDGTKNTVKSMKTSAFNYLYKSKFSLKNMINEKQIESILDKENDFKNFIKGEDNYFNMTINIDGNEYPLIFGFVDPDHLKSKNQPWICLQ